MNGYPWHQAERANISQATEKTYEKTYAVYSLAISRVTNARGLAVLSQFIDEAILDAGLVHIFQCWIHTYGP